MSLETEACARRTECKNDPSPLPWKWFGKTRLNPELILLLVYLFVVPHPLKCVKKGQTGLCV